MVDLARQAFSTNNFDLASEIYERQIKETGPNRELFLGLADSQARNGHLRKAFTSYSRAYRLGNVKSDQLNHLVTALVSIMSDKKELITNKAADEEEDVFACGICRGLWREPVTISCGHTFCRKCLEKEQSKTCKKCGLVQKHTRLSSLKTNVLLSQTCEKWFPNELQAMRLKDDGNKHFERGDFRKAVVVYSQAFELAPSDHLLVSNRSYANACAGAYKEAFRDAEMAIKIKPDWPKGYYRRGNALSGLDQHEEAAYSYLQCLALDSSVISARKSLAKSLHLVLSPLLPEDVKRAELQTYLNPTRLTQVLNANSAAEDTAEGMHVAIDEETIRTLKESLKRSLQKDGFTSDEVTDRMLFGDQAGHFPNTLHTGSGNELNIENQRKVPQEMRNKDDFECTLCYRLLFHPVATPCGHVFCRQCLDRCLDHNTMCPLCKSSLVEYLAERRQASTEAVENILLTYFPEDFAERKQVNEEEISAMAQVLSEDTREVPIFVCTLAYPKVLCPLHIFEPRYRLMVRQCMESGTRQFGMCVCLEEGETHANFGTLLEIRDVQYFPDGRSVVDTVGGHRFKIISRGQRDGYDTARIQIIQDNSRDETEEQEVKAIHDKVHKEASDWFESLPRIPKLRILQHFGEFPDVESSLRNLPDGPAWAWWLTAVLPLDQRAQLTIIAMTSLRERLLAIARVLTYVQRKTPAQ